MLYTLSLQRPTKFPLPPEPQSSPPLAQPAACTPSLQPVEVEVANVTVGEVVLPDCTVVERWTLPGD